jgi:hypothetical protein
MSYVRGPEPTENILQRSTSQVAPQFYSDPDNLGFSLARFKVNKKSFTRPLATVADFLAYAKELYGFVPTPTTEREFKRRYAQEALAVGLTKDQVVRIYALETGGQGTYDMQSGINPITRQGRPISSAQA